MLIQCSIYQEIGKGERVSLAKLADEKLKTTNRPLRIAVDISIWLFQIQASEGGANPEIRTLYFRLVRLLLYGIRPLFVFDGPDKPPFKRGAPTSSATSASSKKAKRLIQLFGFQHHNAPGEAEAECALIQKLGIVDIVLSEDVDTLAFGASCSMRSWTAEGARGSKAPTHVTVYDAEKIKAGASRLDREGMILVALMSGGDYITSGIPGCGTKVACEAARAGFGYDLCEVAAKGDAELAAWTERLKHELSTNESGFFRTRHKALAAQIDEKFPDRAVLGYHIQPVVSQAEDLRKLEEALDRNNELDVRGLRDFVDEEFSWKHLIGAKKFLRQISPALLVDKLRELAGRFGVTPDMEEQVEREERLILSILGRREHFSTDASPEVKIAFIPMLVADLDLDQESIAEDVEESECSSDEEEWDVPDIHSAPNHSQDSDVLVPSPPSPKKRRSRLHDWDPSSPAKAWLLESFVSRGAPLSLERWNSEVKANESRQAQIKANVRSGGMRKGALDAYFFKTTKPHATAIANKDDLIQKPHQEFSSSGTPLEDRIERASIAPRAQDIPRAHAGAGLFSKPVAKKKPLKTKQAKSASTKVDVRGTTPWTLAQQRREI